MIKIYCHPYVLSFLKLLRMRMVTVRPEKVHVRYFRILLRFYIAKNYLTPTPPPPRKPLKLLIKA